MKALTLTNKTLSFSTNMPKPSPGPGEVLVRVRLAGICSTDLELMRGYYPYNGVPGHEFVGEVVEALDIDWIGRRVVGDINIVCGTCGACRSGRPTHCDARSVLGIVNHDGAFAEYLTLPAANLHAVPDNVPDEAAVFTEPLAAALEIIEQIHICPTDHVLVIGAGRLGQLVAQVLKQVGCDLRVAARHPNQQELLTACGIATVHAEEVAERSVDIIIEATGSPSGFVTARKLLRPRGTLVLKSTYHGELTTDFSSLVVDEITLVGSRCGPFEPALRLLANSHVDPRPLISDWYRLSNGVAAMKQAATPGTMKILLEP